MVSQRWPPDMALMLDVHTAADWLCASSWGSCELHVIATDFHVAS